MSIAYRIGLNDYVTMSPNFLWSGQLDGWNGCSNYCGRERGVSITWNQDRTRVKDEELTINGENRRRRKAKARFSHTTKTSPSHTASQTPYDYDKVP